MEYLQLPPNKSHTVLHKNNLNEDIEKGGSLNGRSVTKLVAASEEASNNSDRGGGSYCCCLLGAAALVAGGIMFAIAKNGCDDPTRGCNEDLLYGGKISMTVGGSMLTCALICALRFSSVICQA